MTTASMDFTIGFTIIDFSKEAFGSTLPHMKSYDPLFHSFCNHFNFNRDDERSRNI